MTISRLKKAKDVPPARVKYDWEAIADQLRASPGEWFLVFEKGPKSVAQSIIQGDTKALAGAEFETRTANNTRETPRTCTLWVRYVPANQRPKPVSTLKKESKDAASDRGR